ncbi:MAG: ATP-binding protein [Patescibacteria group bacterium]
MEISKYISQTEREISKKHIVNILILGLIVVSLVAFLVLLVHKIQLRDEYTGESPLYPAGVLLLVVVIYRLFRENYVRLSSYLLLSVFIMITTVLMWKSGVENQFGLLFFAFLIALTGILVELKYFLYVVIFIATIYVILSYFQITGINDPYLQWKNFDLLWSDTISYIAMFFIISVVSGLYNWEIHRSLRRALLSEEELKEERDLLEVRVEQRTKELKQSQIQQIGQLSKFVEYGRSMVGLMHDLVNPVTAISLNLSFIEKMGQDKNKIKEMQAYVHRALLAAKKMEKYVLSSKEKIKTKQNQARFSVADEINDVLLLFNYKAKRSGISLDLNIENGLYVVGEQSKFGQIVSNLVSNAIDAFEVNQRSTGDKKIAVNVFRFDNLVQLVVEDNAGGIKKENLKKIFEPFFTTKSADKGIGIGLAVTKDIVVNDFNGKISVDSKWGEGTVFYVSIPGE